MHIEALKIFCDVVGYSSFSRAAKENGITQSAASQAIGKLEKHLGVRLIDRSHRPWSLTAEGKTGYARSREVLDSFYRLESEVHHAHAGHQATVRVATIYSVGLAYMSNTAPAFGAKHPEAKLRLEHLHPEEVARRVLADEADIGVMAFAPTRRELKSVPWREEEMVVAMAPGHSLAKLRHLTSAHLEDCHLVSFDGNIAVGRKIASFLKGQGVSFEVVARFDNIEAIKRAVEAGIGIALLPEPTLAREVKTGSLIMHHLSDARMVRPLSMIYRSGSEVTPAMQAFMTYMQNVAADK